MVDIIAPVTDYVSDSILTTRGDLLKRGPADTERFPKGAGGQIIRVGADGVDLQYERAGQFLFEDEHSVSNTGVITLTGSFSTIVTIDLGNVYINGRYGIYVMVNGNKGALAGNTHVRIAKDSGSADIQMYHDFTTLVSALYIDAITMGYFRMSGLIKITGAGTLVLKLEGWSTGSTTEISINAGQIYAHRMRIVG